MTTQKIVIERIRTMIGECEKTLFTEVCSLESHVTESDYDPIPRHELGQRKWRQINIGDNWGKSWGRAWFKFSGTVPQEVLNNPAEYEAHINTGSEGCVYLNDKPYIGLTHKEHPWGASGQRSFHEKRKVPLRKEMFSGKNIEILVDASANRLFGAGDKDTYHLSETRIVRPDHDAEKLFFDIYFLFDLAVALPEDSGRRRTILRSLNDIANIINTADGARKAAAILTPLMKGQGSEYATEVVSVGHSHLDLAWLWPLRETRRKALRTSATMLRMMERYPGYVFGFSQPQMYEWIEQDEPEFFKEITERIKEGRWECFGALWVEPDTNVPSYESLIRQCLYGKQYWKSRFGVESKVAWLPDTFGFTAAFPQILKGCGIDTFITIKLSWNEMNAFPYHAFQWEGIDGSRVNGHILPTHDYNFDNAPQRLREADAQWEAYGLLDSYLSLYGIGDGGGGPSIEHIEYAQRADDCEGLPRVKMTNTGQFFKKIRKASATLPVWKGELYFELHRGTYTTQSEVKRFHALIELALHDLECLSALYGLTPPEDRVTWWKSMLLHEFHDILPGSSIHDVYVEAKQTLPALLKTVTESTHELLSPQKGDAVTLVNTKGIEDRGWFEHGEGHIAYSLPPFSRQSFTPADHVSQGAAVNLQDHHKKGQGYVFTNGVVTLIMSDEGAISSLRDERNGRELLAGSGVQFMLWEDIPHNWDAWDVTIYYRETQPEIARLKDMSLLFSDERGIRLKLEYTVGKSRLTSLFTLRPDSPRVDINLHVDWKERKKMLRLSVPTSIHSSFVNCGVQGGYVQRSTLMNSSWEQARFEEPVHRFADISDGQAGLAVFAFAKYGYHFSNSLVDLNLLRSPTSPDPEADAGEHDMRMALYCHNSSFHESDTIEDAECFYHRPYSLPGITSVPSEELICPADSNLRVRSLKPAESGKGLVLRIAETKGYPGKIRLEGGLLNKARAARYCNYLEETQEDIPIHDGIEISAGPFEVKSVWLDISEKR